mmetsp:Transcript_37541/g.83586  ORF Transcript_37541/g.83586 Transcript_37541/m.83586 type:complete len:288 (+) Transcript_37541:235-1098(+)|eukprot:CAMPEP_0202890896 /NCGR_PEP_ID=MMETSP1392-20130828/1155_1 /ASSEMBLY_ACC=CAM_ASM_000868 /TAXON_ID=225041 /ORGANISM="Chlamydomonas chlamydogama, Strain SAG 11-48b" /LENGTH=287 /DNA_ID=CAMNT_0049574547 /DNA_START=235 /DNA_END=1098 /DNA_ORIENTATION=+
MADLTFNSLEEAGYYAVVRALQSCGKLDNFETELLLTDLQTALSIPLEFSVSVLDMVQKDQEALHLGQYGSATAGAPAPPAAAPPLRPQPSMQRTAGQPSALSIPQYDASPYGQAGGSQLNKGKSKKGAMAPPPAAQPAAPTRPAPPLSTPSSAPPSSKTAGNKKSKSAAGTPTATTPISTGAKPKPPAAGLASKSFSDSKPSRPLVGAAAAAVADKQQRQAAQTAQAELERLNKRERDIFMQLLQLGVKEDDPDLNDVHKALLKWYRLDARQREIEGELIRISTEA